MDRALAGALNNCASRFAVCLLISETDFMKAFVRHEKLDSFPDAGSSWKILKRVICLIMKGLQMALFFAYPTLCVRKLLIISKLLVEAAGVEPDIGTENTQVTDTESA
jgi:hypothetical protein